MICPAGCKIQKNSEEQPAQLLEGNVKGYYECSKCNTVWYISGQKMPGVKP